MEDRSGQEGGDHAAAGPRRGGGCQGRARGRGGVRRHCRRCGRHSAVRGLLLPDHYEVLAVQGGQILVSLFDLLFTECEFVCSILGFIYLVIFGCIM